MKKNTNVNLQKIIYSITIRGHKVIFYETDDDCIDYCVTNVVSQDVFDMITCYLIDEGIFEHIYGKEYVEQLLEEGFND